MHPFDTAIALTPQGEHRFEGATSPAYANFIGPYGGITAAQMVHAVLQHPQRLGEPVALTVNFAAALADGGFVAQARPARTNRSTQHWIVELLQGGETVATATVMTAVRRETWSGHEVRMPQVPRPTDVARAPHQGVEWLRRYDMRFLEGMVPREWQGQGDAASRTRLWVRDEPQRPLDFAALTAMSDIFFPRIWLRRATQTPLGTVTMTVYYHADGAQLAATGSGFLLAQAQGQGFRNGYFDHGGQLWNEAGELLVTTQQVVYFKD
jgi:acyl-CoA thioesterase